MSPSADAKDTAPPEPPTPAQRATTEHFEPPPPAPFRGAVPTTCAGIDSALKRAFAEKSCKADDDCTVAAVYCSCRGPINKSGASKVEALNRAFDAQSCAQKGPPRPCATCAPTPRPRCLGHSCQ